MRRVTLLSSAILVAMLATGARSWWTSRSDDGPGAGSTTGPASGDRRPGSVASELAPSPTSPERLTPADEACEIDPEAIDPADVPADWPASVPVARLRLEVVDALSGKKLDAMWALEGPTAGPPPPDAPPRSESDPPDLLLTNDWRPRRSQHAAAVPVFDRRAVVRPRVNVPGYAGIEREGRSVTPGAETIDRRLHVPTGVRELRARVPLYKTVPLELTVLGPDGRPAEGAEVRQVRIARHIVDLESTTADERGVLRLRDVPYVPGEVVEAFVNWRYNEAVRRGDGDGNPPPELVTSPPPDPVQAWSAIVRLAGPTDSTEWKFEADPAEDAAEELPDEVESDRIGARVADPSAPRGTIRARVVAADGAPIVGETVWFGSDEQARTDAKGEVSMGDRAVGSHDLLCEPDGHFPMRARVAVVAGRTTDVVLREPTGAKVVVTVVDPRGLPRPSARIDVRARGGDAVFDVTDGVMRVDDFADERGRRTFARVRPGQVRFVVTWRGHVAKTTLDVADGETKDVHVVVR
jgi:hypothetical protein